MTKIVSPFHIEYLVRDCSPIENHFNSLVKTKMPLQAVRPFLIKPVIQSANSQKPESEKSFFERYWYYMVAFALFFLLTTSSEEPAAKKTN